MKYETLLIIVCMLVVVSAYNDIKRELGLGATTISKACKGQTKFAYGYLWKFEMKG